VRSFEDKPAERVATTLLVALVGASGSGKTFSALRLATGIQKVSGGEIYLVDTESRRALHYADRFKFRHVQFDPPFSPADYLAAFEHCVSKGAKIVIYDSASHEHDGKGGTLDMHEDELDRMAGDNHGRRQALNFPAWALPKREHAKFKLRVVQANVTCIFCFRAKEKVKMPRKGSGDKDMIELGWQPLGEADLVYEMGLRCLLPPGSDGVPRWTSDAAAETETFKLPIQFRGIFPPGKPVQLSESVGEDLARWAAGPAAVKPVADLLAEYATVADAAALASLDAECHRAWRTASAEEKEALRGPMAAAKARVSK
jgi:ABC-type oligopeptide transport system ATPase subunit